MTCIFELRVEDLIEETPSQLYTQLKHLPLYLRLGCNGYGGHQLSPNATHDQPLTFTQDTTKKEASLLVLFSPKKKKSD